MIAPPIRMLVVSEKTGSPMNPSLLRKIVPANIRALVMTLRILWEKIRVSFLNHAVSQDRAFTVPSVTDDVTNIVDFHQIGPSFFHQVASGCDNDPVIQPQKSEFIAFAYQLI